MVVNLSAGSVELKDSPEIGGSSMSVWNGRQVCF